MVIAASWSPGFVLKLAASSSKELGTAQLVILVIKLGNRKYSAAPCTSSRFLTSN